MSKKGTKIVQKSQEMPVTIRTSLRALIYTLLIEKRGFFKVSFESFTEKWFGIRIIRKPPSDHVDLMQQECTRSWLFGLASLVPSLSMISGDLDSTFGIDKTKLEKQRRNQKREANRGDGGVQRTMGPILVCDRSKWKREKGDT